MTIAFITGSSRGLGLALAELLLKDKNVKVVGISRHQTIENPKYEHIALDLSDLKTVEKFRFHVDEYDKYILINNAGVIEPIAHVGHTFSTDIVSNYNVNLIAPSLLTNTFLRQFSELKKPIHIINVSSGAGKHPIDGWSTYNASKAGLDMFSLVIDRELKINNDNHIRIHSIAPGVVDTEMQGTIRNTDIKNFSTVDKFKDYFSHGDLAKPSDIAKKYKKVIDNPDDFPEVVISVRDF
ncbi:MAG: SDR family NAD(P)-dependent oxidoreductase [Bacteroidota bacterium]